MMLLWALGAVLAGALTVWGLDWASHRFKPHECSYDADGVIRRAKETTDAVDEFMRQIGAAT